MLLLFVCFLDPCVPIVKGPHVKRIEYSKNLEGLTYPSGTTANITCDADLTVQGDIDSVICQEGYWGPALPVCVSNSK